MGVFFCCGIFVEVIGEVDLVGLIAGFGKVDTGLRGAGR